MGEFNSLERLRLALSHKEPDRVPVDIGASTVTGISTGAYERLRSFLGLPQRQVNLFDVRTRLAAIDDDVYQYLFTDVRGLIPKSHSSIQINQSDGYSRFKDEWGVEWRMLLDGGLYYEPVGHPLSGTVDLVDIDAYAWPDPKDSSRLDGLVAEAERIGQTGKAILMNHWVWGIFETATYLLRGAESFYRDLSLRPSVACYLMDRILDQKLAFWEEALALLGDRIHVIKQNDDLAGQDRMLISPQMYRKYIKPRHKKLFSFIKKHSSAYLFLHSDGAITELLPDFVELGVDILNPLQHTAQGMDLKSIKRRFGEDLAFWGAGVDTQWTLPYGTPDDVRTAVARNIETLAPGGGFVFATVHNIQADTPPQNIMAMMEALEQFSSYV